MTACALELAKVPTKKMYDFPLTMVPQVARVTGSFHIAPASKATGSQLGALLVPHRLQPDEVPSLATTPFPSYR